MSGVRAWLFGGGSCKYKVLLVGDEQCGKTTFLDRLKFGEVRKYPNPTVDVNPETVEYPMGYSWDICEIGGGSKISRQLTLRHLSPATLVIYLHDCENIADRVPASFPSLLQDMVNIEAKHIWVVFNKQDIRGFKPARVSGLGEKYEKELAKYRGRISGRVLTHRLSPKSGEGTFIVLENMFATLRDPKDRSPRLPGARPPDPDVALQLVVGREIAQEDLDPDDFWAALQKGHFIGWSHYNFVKAVYMVVLEAVEAQATSLSPSPGAKQTCFDIAEAFGRYMRGLGRTSSRWFQETRHKTLIIFWVLKIQHAIRDYRVHNKMRDYPGVRGFHGVLRHSPTLIINELWRSYYSVGSLESQAAINGWLSPNTQPLPWVTFNLDGSADLPAVKEDPDRLLRYAFGVLQYVHKKGFQNIGVTAHALRALERSTMRLRLQYPWFSSYSETRGYFWLHVVQVALQSLYTISFDSDEKISSDEPPASCLTFSGFKELVGIDSDSWRQCYSRNIWDSIEARSKYFAPDLAPVEKLINRARTSRGNPQFIQRMKKLLTEDNSREPSAEELSFRAELVLGWSKELNGSNPVIESHTHLLLFLYTQLFSDIKADGPEVISSLRIQRATEIFLEVSGPLVDALTHKHFWFQQFLAGLCQAESRRLEEDQGTDISTFAGFVINSLQLVNEDLPSQYYDAKTWYSENARDTIMPPDKRDMANILEISGLSELSEWVEV